MFAKTINRFRFSRGLQLLIITCEVLNRRRKHQNLLKSPFEIRSNDMTFLKMLAHYLIHHKLLIM